jgi:hypothetical protein
MIRHIVIVLTMLSLGWASITARAQSGDLIPQKKAFELPSYTTVAGETIKSIRIGWEAAGISQTRSSLLTIFPARVTHSVSTRPLIRSQATGMRSSDPARPSIPTGTTCSRPIR